jgi:hypothetical protein
VRLTRDRDELVEGLTEPHELVVLLDRKLVKQLTGHSAARAAGPRDRGRPPERPAADPGRARTIWA